MFETTIKLILDCCQCGSSTSILVAMRTTLPAMVEEMSRAKCGHCGGGVEALELCDVVVSPNMNDFQDDLTAASHQLQTALQKTVVSLGLDEGTLLSIGVGQGSATPAPQPSDTKRESCGENACIPPTVPNPPTSRFSTTNEQLWTARERRLRDALGCIPIDLIAAVTFDDNLPTSIKFSAASMRKIYDALSDTPPPDPRNEALKVAEEALTNARWQFASHAGEEDNVAICDSALVTIQAAREGKG